MSQTSISFDAGLRDRSVSIAEDEVVSTSKPASSDSLLLELEIELAEKSNQMRALAEKLALSLESKFKLEVLKLPKAVRTMTMREFCVQYGGDVDEAMNAQTKRSKADDVAMMPPPPPGAAAAAAAAANAMPPPARGGRAGRGAAANAAPTPGGRGAGGRTSRKRGANDEPSSVFAPQNAPVASTPGAGARSTRSRLGVAATPSATPGGVRSSMQTPMGAPGGSQAVMFTPRVHETPRVMRGGEVGYSANGSPINVIDTVRGKAGGGKRSRTSAAPAVMLTMGDGSEVDLADAVVRENLEGDAEAKATAVEHLEALQAQVEAHLKALRGGNLLEM